MNKLPFELIKRTIIGKKEAQTSDKFGYQYDRRPVEDLILNGIVNIDKPAGPTSHQVSAYVKQIFGLNKAGHSGTLDPNVTGVLPVALGRATKIVQALLPAGKEYVCIMHIHAPVAKEKIIFTIQNFIGSIRQLPPLKSAVKREERERNIYYIDILEIEGQDVLFRVGCQAGTYIRKLCTDIGKKMGIGAHMAELRRTRAGPFDESTLCTLQDVQDAVAFWKEDGNEEPIRKCVQPVENATLHLPKIWVMDTTVDSLCHGASLNIPGIAKFNSEIQVGDNVAIMTLKNELVALGVSKMTSDDILQKEKGIVAAVDAVFMEPGVYPKIVRK